MKEAEVRVLPCEDKERVVGRPRTGGAAAVGEVCPGAGVLGVVVVIVDFVISDNGIGSGGSRVEFCYCCSNAVEVGEVLVLPPLEGEDRRGIEVADGCREAVF